LKDAESLLQGLKKQLLMLDSLPPINADYADAAAERASALEVYEYAVIYSVKCGDKDSFQRYMSCLRPYYTDCDCMNKSSNKATIMGLKLLYLLVENRLSEFHCEIELLTEAELKHPHIEFCTKIEQFVMIGSYEQVLQTAQSPPVPYYSFFVSSLLETVRSSIAECMQAAYKSLLVSDAMKLLMFNSEKETMDFITANYEHWNISASDSIQFATKEQVQMSDAIPSFKVMREVLSYASELERIV
jgi:26S proteasome regulatory subunit N12